MSVQPVGMKNNHGVILTVGYVINGERAAITLPMAVIEGTSLDGETLCSDACNSFIASQLTNLLALLSEDAYVSFISAEGMIDDRIPNRYDYAPTTHKGTDTSPAAPGQVAYLMTFYEDPADGDVGEPLRSGKTFLPGPAMSWIDGNTVASGKVSDLSTLAQAWIDGYASLADPSNFWYRVLSTPRGAPGGHRPPDTVLRRCLIGQGRGYLATQRRRLIPH